MDFSYNIQYVTETASTNDLAKTLAKQNAPHGTVIIADSQHKGRGKGQSEWFSPSGVNIYMSVIFRPEPDFPCTLINVISSLSLVYAIKDTCNLTVWPKWPNDIYCCGKKLGGILSESSSAGSLVTYIVTGIGLNVNTKEFPYSLKDTATSIFLETGKLFDRGQIVESLLKHFAAFYDKLKFEKQTLIKTWELLSKTINSTVSVSTDAGAICGKALGINDNGFLIVEKPEGSKVLLISGDITHAVNC
ncbi:biotin--[acetyl-CoA-carboxylase] ligase [Candidatus Magnetomonas plexicatena]|uniref:biotin--[acetyl-CoA-carboxylase] ligase n=1 Tax=Candidatus Magnetomonas plexicatena TaxID=2552947 RepID=UPI00110114BE|nr:biotin--[acetyl-CoA-carboxylase] ligase [Nitrospirales bacterium LBB_01]